MFRICYLLCVCLRKQKILFCFINKSVRNQFFIKVTVGLYIVLLCFFVEADKQKPAKLFNLKTNRVYFQAEQPSLFSFFNTKKTAEVSLSNKQKDKIKSLSSEELPKDAKQTASSNFIFTGDGKHSHKFRFLNPRFLELGLEYPLNFGLHSRYFLGKDLYARVGLGFMPGLFLNTFEKLSPAFGYLNTSEAQLIANTFENSVYLDVRLSWLPDFKKSQKSNQGGPYMEVGLFSVFYGKGELKGTRLANALGVSFDRLKTYSVKTNTYNMTVHIGYQIPVERMKFNFELGLMKVFYSHVFSGDAKKLHAPYVLNQEQEEQFKRFLRKKGWVFPTVSVWVSLPLYRNPKVKSDETH